MAFQLDVPGAARAVNAYAVNNIAATILKNLCMLLIIGHSPLYVMFVTEVFHLLSRYKI